MSKGIGVELITKKSHIASNKTSQAMPIGLTMTIKDRHSSLN
jgi:hypothetical protein